MASPDVNAFFDAATNTVSYVVADPATGQCAVIDPVLDYDAAAGRISTHSVGEIIQFIADQNLSLDLVLETHVHADHLTAAPVLRKQFDSKIAIGTHIKKVQKVFCDVFNLGDLATDGSQFDLLLSDGDEVPIGNLTCKVMHTPGHTMGSLCIVHRDSGVLFSGDMILGTGTTVISPDHGDMAAYIESMRRLLTVKGLTMIAPGHGPVINTPYEKFQELIDHRLQREAQVLKLVSEGTGTVDALLEAIYVGGIHPKLHDTAKNQILSHLAKLERDGRLKSDAAEFSAV